jgi:hypothetical protein
MLVATLAAVPLPSQIGLELPHHYTLRLFPHCNRRSRRRRSLLGDSFDRRIEVRP